MADTDDTDQTLAAAGDTVAAPPQDDSTPGGAPAVGSEEPAEELAEDTEPEEPALEPEPEEATSEAAAEEPVSAAEEEPAEDATAAFPPFGAQFSSPEPTAVVARPRRRATRPAAAAEPDEVATPAPAAPVPAFVSFVAPLEAAPEPRRRARRGAGSPVPTEEDAEVAPLAVEDEDEAPRSRRGRSRRRPAAEAEPVEAVEDTTDGAEADTDEDRDDDRDDAGSAGSRRRRRGRRGRGRGRSGEDSADGEDGSEDRDPSEDAEEDTDAEETDEDAAEAEDTDESGSGSSTRRRRRRRRRGSSEDRSEESDDDERPERAGRGGRLSSDDDVRGISGSTRLEAKRQRRRDGRDTGRRRAPILTEAEFLARREAVDRAMVIRQRGDRTQIAVLEDDVLVEHYVTQAQATSFAGNVYLGRVQNVLPSMEAAFVDIGKGRNAVLYAGEVNWDAAGLSGKQRSIETALKSGDKVLVQVTKDPIGHKGARLTQQINLPGRFLVYVPGGSMTGISRKLPDTERQRLKDILKKIVPDDAGVIIRTAAEGASEEELTRDVARLQAQWDVIQKKSESTSNAPSLLYGEPDLAIRVIRDVFNEDFKELVVQGDDAWDTVEAYVAHVSPELSGRLSRYTGEGDVFRDKRIDEQLAKALDRKVWLPSGGSLVIDRTEAMTVVDVNTGKFTGSGGNLEQTVTRNNMEAAEEIVRQLRLRDIGGIIVIDFIDMVLESNRDLVLRRLTECLGRDRTKHQVAEVTSLGLVQMTRKRVGQGLLEVFSEPCEHCRGRGILVHLDPVDERRRGNGGGTGHGPGGHGGGTQGSGNQGSGSQGGANQGGGGQGGRRGERSAAKEETEDAPASVESADTPAADGETAGRTGSRRNRGRRNRGQAGEERAAEDAAVLADAPEVEDAPVLAEAETTTDDGTTAEADTAADETPDADAAAPAEPSADTATDTATDTVAEPVADSTGDAPAAAPDSTAGEPVVTDAQLLPAAEQGTLTEPVVTADAPSRPRRRRAASRPAGPPA